MEGVHVVQHHHVDILLDKTEGEEMTTHIEVHTTVGKAGCVIDHHGRDLNHLCLFHHGQCLPECLYAVEHTGRGRAFYQDLLVVDRQSVTFLVADLLIQTEKDGGFLVDCLIAQCDACLLLHILCQETYIAQHILVVFLTTHRNPILQYKYLTVSCLYLIW